MTVDELIALRKALNFTQSEMAEMIGLKHRAYQDIEGGHATLRKMHILAVERVVLALGTSIDRDKDSFKAQWFSKLVFDAKKIADELD